jgi:GNAT superfamily N-acetyltransferase
VPEWTPERVWDAVEAWRWSPPSATRVVTDRFELAVTPGTYALTYVYGFRVDAANQVEPQLDELKARIVALGGTGARFQVTPRSRPTDLADRLLRRGYRPAEEAEVLCWPLRDREGRPSLPAFSPPAGLAVREIRTDSEYDRFRELMAKVFGDPPPPAETRRRFLSEFRRSVRDHGHSDRFLALDGSTPVGLAGMEVAGPVARFWGSGVLAEHRHRGIYGGLVRARCEAAAERGAEVALVTARVGTSGPILKRHGFTAVGTVQLFEARW